MQEKKVFTGREIRELRVRLRKTQKQFAELLNVAPVTVQKWEQHPEKPLQAKYVATLQALSAGVGGGLAAGAVLAAAGGPIGILAGSTLGALIGAGLGARAPKTGRESNSDVAGISDDDVEKALAILRSLEKLTPEERADFIRTLQKLTPDERAQFLRLQAKMLQVDES